MRLNGLAGRFACGGRKTCGRGGASTPPVGQPRGFDAVSKVAELDLADVPPTSHPLDLVNAWADDEPHESLPLDDVFANAPAREGDLFRVPPTA